MPNKAPTHRVDWVDIAKGLGIVLVVVGHVLRGLGSSHLMSWTPAVQFADRWIYSFHMPLFFFLTGLFLFGSATKRQLSDFSSDKLRTIAYPYFVWSFLTVLLKSVLGPIPNTPRDLSDLSQIAFAPIEQFWFLYVLFMLTMLFGLLFRLGLPPWMGIAIAILIYPGVLPLSQNWGMLNLMRLNAIYVAAGAFIGSNYLQRVSDIGTTTIASIAVVGFGVMSVGVALTSNEMLLPFLALSGILGSIAVALMLTRTRVAGMIGFLGRHSLEIYVAHTMASGAVRVVLQSIGITSPTIHLIAGTGAGLLLPLAIYYTFRMVGFRFAFTFPKERTTTVPWATSARAEADKR
jgi:fucose 4-O-acetylase-like acetyltransferase